MKSGEAKNIFYSDNHKAEGTVQYRWIFVKRYIIREYQFFRWIQITRNQSTKMAYYGLFKDFNGYNYNDDKTWG